MPDVGSLLQFALVSYALVIIPGPSVLFVLSRSIAHGRRVGVQTVLGNAAGAYVQLIGVAIGLGAVIERSAAAFHTIKFAGAAYLVWLGVQSIRHRHDHVGDDDDAAAVRSTAQVVREGFVVGVTNPKTIVFFAALLPQYVVADGAPAALQMLVLGLVFEVVALTSDSLYAMIGGSARAWFRGAPQRQARLTALGGTITAALGIGLALEGSATSTD